MTAIDERGMDGVEGVAIIGMDGRFPGADDVNAYWKNLLEGRETLQRFDDGALDPAVPESLRTQREYVRVRGVMPEADRFDAAFFGISPREAEMLDPQQRVFLEMCWRALEDAGYAPGTHDAMTGVFAGMSYNTYFNAHVAKHPELLAAYGDIPALVANEKDYLATRVGYKLDLRGPCINISTACSTSLVATCHAVNSLLDYQCDMALAGGISVLCPQERGYLYQEGSIFSPDGHCRPFDADAKGTVFGNGGGVVVLKRLSEALADGDTIHAVIRGAALNNDGAGKVSFTAPSVEGQAEVVQMAQELAGVRADEISYIEAHGTGTSLGDPIEIAALTRAFGVHTREKGFCGVGSVKGNIGHLDAASGVAGLIKTAIALRERRLPPTLHYRNPNPELGLDASPFFVVDTPREWPANGRPRRAGVSSFGLGGTNAHVVLEEAPRQAASDDGRSCQLLVLSTRTETALEAARDALARQLADKPAANFADLAYTLQRGRRAFEHRLAVAAHDAAEALDLLNGKTAGHVRRGVAQGVPQAVFMFPGQGSQYTGMCEQVYREEASVREAVDRCAEALRDVLEFDLRDVMFGRIDNAAELLDETQYTQPALFVTEYALARLWMQWGVKPAVMLGHSIGEFAAAALADVFSVEDAVRVVAERGRLMQAQEPGSMLSVRLPEEEIGDWLVPGVTLAAVNAPGLCVLSGGSADIARLQKRLEENGVGCRALRTSHAFHSAMMDPAVDAFRAFLEGIPLAAPRRKIISTLTGRVLAAEEATDPAYWARQLREPVRFMRALQEARTPDAPQVFIEAGPGIATSTFAAQAFADEADVQVVGSLGRRADNRSEYTALVDAAGRLWTQGVALDWQALHAGERRRRVPAPTYRFERTRHWLDSVPQPEGASRNTAARAPENAARTDTRPLTAQLAALLAEVSGMSVNADHYETGFAELGLDSLFLTQFSQALKKRFDVALRVRDLLVDCNSIVAVAARVEQQQPAKMPEEAASQSATEAATHAPENAIREPTNAERDYIRDLSRRYTWRTSGSKAYLRTHRDHLAEPHARHVHPLLEEMAYPIVAQSSSGARLQDVDGNAYIDLVNGGGSSLLGHAAPCVTDAIRQQLKRGYDAGPQTPLAGRVARQLQALTGFGRFAFCATSSEALLAAARAAREVTARDKVVLLGDDGRAPLPGDAETLEYGSDAALERVRARGEALAAVLVAPVPVRRPDRYSPRFLHALREACTQGGAALVFDETDTGFRVHPGGVQGLSGIRADLAVYGNICGGGMPLGVIAGESRFMAALDDGQRHGDVLFHGADERHPLSLAAAEATLRHLLEAGPSLQKTLDARTAQLAGDLERQCGETGAPVRVRHFSSWFLFDIDPRVPCGGLLFCRLRAGGIHVLEGEPCFLSAAHTDADLARISQVFRESLDEMRTAGFFDGLSAPETAAPQPALRLADAAADTAARAQGASAPPVANARLGRRPDGQPAWFVPDPQRPGRYREVRGEIQGLASEPKTEMRTR